MLFVVRSFVRCVLLFAVVAVVGVRCSVVSLSIFNIIIMRQGRGSEATEAVFCL